MQKYDALGSHIRKIRKLQQKTLQDVADSCGFTKSMLSKIEHGHIVPAIKTLTKIALTLNTTIPALIEKGKALGNVSISERIDKIDENKLENGLYCKPLAVEFKRKKILPCVYIVYKDDLNDKFRSHAGEEFFFILEGILEFQVDEKVYVLRPGESLFFNAVAKHRTIGLQTPFAKYLVIFC